ncbi:hypothetical protein GCM10027614_00280 [Micromonospora vulcania]
MAVTGLQNDPRRAELAGGFAGRVEEDLGDTASPVRGQHVHPLEFQVGTVPAQRGVPDRDGLGGVRHTREGHRAGGEGLGRGQVDRVVRAVRVPLAQFPGHRRAQGAASGSSQRRRQTVAGGITAYRPG